ncbi:hypothetical protein P691DRAFT_679442, partial [Macrolepiota fuliginosa MF-IS2]
IRGYNFGPGKLVLLLDKEIELYVGCKCKPYYFGPMVVFKRLRSRACILAKINDAISRLKLAVLSWRPFE